MAVGDSFALAAINFFIVLMTVTRMTILCSAALGAFVILFAPHHTFNRSARLQVVLVSILLGGGALVFLWPEFQARFTGNTSGRDFIWQSYLQAINVNPWFGRGVGSGTILLQTIDDYRAKFTTAAHNEYLRVTMDGGIFGLAMFVGAIAVWVRSEHRFFRKEEWVLFLGFMLTFIVYSFTDNTLSAPPTLVIFFALALIVQRARQRAILPSSLPLQVDLGRRSSPPSLSA